MEEQEQVSLENLDGGSAIERFNYELQKVIENIHDPNTIPEATRTVSLKVKIKPDKEDRGFAVVGIHVDSSLAPLKPRTTSFYTGLKDGEYVAFEYNPQQQRLFTGKESERKSDNVTPIRGKEA